jgi:hypothetical protein
MIVEDLKIIMSDLIREPRINDEKYKSAYIDGILDFFNKEGGSLK